MYQAIINFVNHIPVYDKIYIGTENYVRGYQINPSSNLPEIQDRLKWNNIIVSTLQLEFPIYRRNLLNTEFLIFADWGIGYNKHRDINIKNKLRGYGLGLRLEMIKLGGTDICLGFNPYGQQIVHVIVNFKNF